MGSSEGPNSREPRSQGMSNEVDANKNGCFEQPKLRSLMASKTKASTLLKENELLKEKLKVHLDIWELDKAHLEENFILEKRGHESKAVAQAFEIASLNIALGFHQQETLQFKLRLEGALDDVEILSSRLQILSLELQEKNDEFCAPNQGLLEREAPWNFNPVNQCTGEKLEQKMPLADTDKSHLFMLDELTKKQKTDIERLKSEKSALASQRKQEVSALVREKNFVWNQLKMMEESFCARLDRKGEKLKLAEESLLKLQCKVDELQKAHDERTVEATILKINLQTAEEELHQLQEELSKLTAENNKGLCNVSLQRSKESTPVIAASDVSLSSDDEACGHIGDLDATEMKREQDKRDLPETVANPPGSKELMNVEEELKKTYKVLDELRLENQNLRLLYAELELQRKEKQIVGQKSEKTNRKSAKDVTTRNLAFELEAVADVSKHPHVKPAKLLVNQFLDKSKMKKKSKQSSAKHRVVQSPAEPNQGLRTRSCVKGKQCKTTQAQFSSLRRQRGPLSISEKKIQSSTFETSKNTHTSTAEETNKVGASSPLLHVCLSKSKSKCPTDMQKRKKFSGFPDKSMTQKREHSLLINGNASTMQTKKQQKGHSSENCKILCPRSPNIGIQKPRDGQMDQTEEPWKVLSTNNENDKGNQNRSLVWGSNSNLGKNKLFSSVFNIPKVVTNTEPN